MRCANGQSEPIRSADRKHRRDFRRRSLAVGEVVLPDLFTHSNHDPLPSNHRAHSECQRHSDLHP